MIRHSFRPHGPSYARLRPVAGGISFESSYDPTLVAAFKAKVPADARRWDPASKAWLVSPKYAKVCAELAETYLGIAVKVPAIASTPANDTRIFRLEYLGRCKERDDGTNAAFGWADGAWSLIFPETVLRDWFAAEPSRPDEQPTLYAVLAVKPGTRFDEIRSSYRRLVKQWHPDMNHNDPDASEQFRVIHHAYEVLSDDAKRKKYDAGLALEQSIRQTKRSYGLNVTDPNGYRSPLKCGWVLANSQLTIGRFIVQHILEWQDVTDVQGRTLVTSWPKGADHFESHWI